MDIDDHVTEITGYAIPPESLFGQSYIICPDGHIYNKHQNRLSIGPSVFYHICHIAAEMTMSALNLVVVANPTPERGRDSSEKLPVPLPSLPSLTAHLSINLAGNQTPPRKTYHLSLPCGNIVLVLRLLEPQKFVEATIILHVVAAVDGLRKPFFRNSFFSGFLAWSLLVLRMSTDENEPFATLKEIPLQLHMWWNDLGKVSRGTVVNVLGGLVGFLNIKPRLDVIEALIPFWDSTRNVFRFYCGFHRP
uniref:Uncharacterized protein LOC104238839 n=1 Tax=Nicotiana sylvestris TaxID=4096 RepID=A0A1U7XYL0_NICSY|nr:PREDICTED: uncharacterized protein LOC104238839 [Nicotiana sylvestris]